FTIMEILVVIGIISLLAVFLVPNLLGAKDRAKETAVKGVMHSVQLAIEAYEMENQIYPVDNNLPLESLCKNYLMAGVYVAAVPKNPFTGQQYKDSDAAGRIIYNYDAATGKYTMTGYNRSGTKKIQELSNM
ncbi:MAG: type II secretion system GspH family protein, partial [Candidatus Margulisbacteria bacterium]|nr:type II secretion system GspH family protein [Candidatus Margulisiibacteriota bacterium]